MEIWKPELLAIFLVPYLDEARERLGAPRVAELLASFGVPEARLRDPTTWVSLELCEALVGRIYGECRDPALFARCGRMLMRPRNLGILWPLFRSFGSPAFAYRQVIEASARYNKIGRYRLREQRPGFVRLEYQSLPGAPRERQGYVCDARMAQLQAIPTLFDLKPADAAHPRCMNRGDESCLYELAWREPARRSLAWGGAALGAGAGALTLLGPSAYAAVGLEAAVACTLVGWMAGRLLALRRSLADRVSEISEAHDALTRSVRANEERYVELLEAKAAVEQKVDLRTAELRETSARLESALREVQALHRARTDFFANVSHELKTPLTLIMGPLEDLAAGREPPGGTGPALQTMQRNAERLLRLIMQILDVAAIDEGRERFVRASTDAEKLVRAASDHFETAARARGVRLEISAPPGLAPIAVDASWVETAITNLLANALRFAERRVEVRLRDSPPALLVEVEDDGPGIAEEDRPRLFERFSQGTSSPERRGGVGLGLALVAETARLHDGDVEVASAPGRTVFSLRLPRAPLPARGAKPEVRSALHLPPDVAAPPEARPERWSGPHPDAPTVLLVEDDPDLRTFLGNVLATRYHVVSRSDGEAALAWAQEEPPDAVVTDVAMPRMGGIELCRGLRAHGTTRAVPVLLITAYKDLERILEAFDAGADDFLAKPFHGRELLARLDVHVRLRRMVRQVAHSERLAMLGLLAASVAHQVRNPLTVLLSGLEGLRARCGGALDDRSDEMLGLMLESARRLDRMTVDLLDVARVGREKEGWFRPADGLRASRQLILAGRPPDVEIRMSLEEDIEVFGRGDDMNHVFLNLIDNAARAVSPRGVVEIGARFTGARFLLEVGDSGQGVDPGRAEWIFHPFATTRPAGEGTGLGLPIAKEIVAQHGGTIRVERSLLGGALFAVELPCERVRRA